MYPDFYHWWRVTCGEPASPVTVRGPLGKNNEEEIEFFLNYRGENVPEAVARSFEWSCQLVQGLRTEAAWSSEQWEKILRGWQNSSLTEGHWTRTLAILKECSELYTFARPIADFLLNGIGKEHGTIPLTSLSQAQHVAEALWKAHPGEPPMDHSQGWIGAAINHPGGILVQFWLRGLSKQRAEAGDGWTGISEDSKRFFRKSSPNPLLAHSLEELSSQVSSIFCSPLKMTGHAIIFFLYLIGPSIQNEQNKHGKAFSPRGDGMNSCCHI